MEKNMENQLDTAVAQEYGDSTDLTYATLARKPGYLIEIEKIYTCYSNLV